MLIQAISRFHLSNDNPCFRCKLAVANFLVSHTCEKISRRYRSKYSTYVFLRKNSKTWMTYMAK